MRGGKIGLPGGRETCLSICGKYAAQLLLEFRFPAHPRRISLLEKKVRTVPNETAPKSVTYADAGVDISRGDRAKERIKYLAQKTFNRNVLGGIGGFGALFRLDMQRWKNPILVSSADGVGTKLKVAFELGLHQTVGADLVNHCVNDIAVQGATPLFFLDYLATGKLDPDVVESVVSGLADACRANGCALIGGETAQMPGFYQDGEYDLAGFIVGAVDRDKMVTGAGIKAGDVLIGMPSTGLHTNGYSLARKLLFEVGGYKPTQYVTAIKEKAGAALLEDAPQLSARDSEAGDGGADDGHGAHHRRRHYGKPAAHSAQGGHGAGGDRLLAGAAHLRASAGAGQRAAGGDDAHVQHGHRADRGHSGGQVYARQKPAGPRRREVLRDRPRGEGRAPGAVHVSSGASGVERS